jgi:polyhydroxybutyrate depolymerase
LKRGAAVAREAGPARVGPLYLLGNLAVLSFLFVYASAFGGTPPGTSRISISSGGYVREAVLHVPKGYDPAAPPPLVVGLHGAGGNGEQFMRGGGWAEMSDRAGFVFAAPDGLPARPRAPADFLTNPRLWNSGQLRAGSPRTEINDVAFVAALLDDLKTRAPYDVKRVFVTGHSNGGGMTFRLAGKLADRIAAIGTVAGLVADESPRPAWPVPTLYILGTQDPLVPLNGGESRLPWGARTTKPVAEYLATWAKAIGCAPAPVVLSEAEGVKTAEYRPAGDGPRLRVLYLEGHGHAWPGGKDSALGRRLLGPDTARIDATETIWNFFASR